MYQIEFNPHPRDRKDEDEALAKRLSKLICGTDQIFPRDDDHCRWQLGTSNDWWMHRDPETNKIVVAFRYGAPYAAEMEALRTTIIFMLHVRDWNQEPEPEFMTVKEWLEADTALVAKRPWHFEETDLPTCSRCQLGGDGDSSGMNYVLQHVQKEHEAGN